MTICRVCSLVNRQITDEFKKFVLAVLFLSLPLHVVHSTFIRKDFQRAADHHALTAARSRGHHPAPPSQPPTPWCCQRPRCPDAAGVPDLSTPSPDALTPPHAPEPAADVTPVPGNLTPPHSRHPRLLLPLTAMTRPPSPATDAMARWFFWILLWITNCLSEFDWIYLDMNVIEFDFELQINMSLNEN
jgi:hypothetical protein